MNPRLIRSAFLPALAAAFAVAGCGTGQRSAPTHVTWLASYDEALVEAGKKDRPILLDFYTDW